MIILFSEIFEISKKYTYVCIVNYEEAKKKFIHSWGVLGSSWGINKTMAQIHALLMISPEALTADQIIEELGISRGNVSMNLKALMEWGVVYKDYKAGDRKDYFYSEKDTWKLIIQVAKERKRRELEPATRMLEEVQQAELNLNNTKEKEFRRVTKDLHKYAKQSEGFVDKFTGMGSNWFFSKAIKLFR